MSSVIDLAAIRARVQAASGRDYWRSLEALADTPAFRELLDREFPANASEWIDPVGRRQFLRLMGASLALAGVGACTRQPAETIVPYVRAPEDLVPGKPLFFATALPLAGVSRGVLVESHMGRPTKVEGNPDHPASLGATDVYAQAELLSLYDPDRAQTLTHLGDVRPWGALLGTVQSALAAQRARRGAGLRILTETVTSPTLADQLRALLHDLPEARWHQYEPCNHDAAREGARRAFGQVVETIYRLDQAEVIVSLDADVLSCGGGSVHYAHDFAARRAPQTRALRFYAIEASPTITGSNADHRLPLPASEIEAFARALAAAIGVPGMAAPSTSGTSSTDVNRWVSALARDLAHHRGTSLVVAGDWQPPAVHALAHAMNAALGNAGRTVVYTDPIDAESVEHVASLRELAADMEAGRVEMLVMLGGNPVYSAPADLGFAEKLARVALRIHLSRYHEETSELCHWHVPEAHPLETWSDGRAFDGTVTIAQPLVAPLYGGRSAHDVLAAMTPQPERTAYELVRDFWHRTFAAQAASGFGPFTAPDGSRFADFERFWRRALHDGVVRGTALPAKTVSLQANWTTAAAPPSAPPPRGLELLFRPDPATFDGRFANNGWLQELPRPLTKLTWDNAALVSPRTAERLALTNEEIVELRHDGRSVRAPIWIVPGHTDDAVTLTLGYGRRRVGRVGDGVGANAYVVRTLSAPWTAPGIELRKTGDRHPLACTQDHHSMEGRHPVRAGTIEEYRRNPAFAREQGAETPPRTLTLYPAYEYRGHAWGMAIDLNACIGCNACVLACQAENNIPIVGKAQVLKGREMHWLRVDRYYAGALDNPQTFHQPLPCMHCENAPCEVVCPVAATVHSDEGLNDMVYNRCVGTRYCANNCPYKVRRFNFLLYADFTTPTLQMMRNPDVTVRSRGVMEKCTYCVQRINYARIEAAKEDRPIHDGDIQTACQQVCPAQAIVFGDLNDPTSRVARLRADPRNYGLLAELNTRPRTTYLARLGNPNPELEPPPSHGESEG